MVKIDYKKIIVPEVRLGVGCHGWFCGSAVPQFRGQSTAEPQNQPMTTLIAFLECYTVHNQAAFGTSEMKRSHWYALDEIYNLQSAIYNCTRGP